MSANERAVALAFAALIAAGPVAAAVTTTAPPLPDAVAQRLPEVRPQGGGEMRHFGFAIYDGYYWAAARGYTIGRPFALDLHYHRALDGAKIAERSVDEIANLGYGTAAERARWSEAMRATFPSVVKGDRLTGVNLPARGVAFFHNGRPIGEIADPSFARAFFGIWLDPGTSRPEFRKRLLGEAPDAP